MTLRSRLILGSAALVLLTLIPLLFVAHYIMGRTILTQVDWLNKVEFNELHDIEAAHPGSAESRQALCHHIMADAGIFLFELTTKDGTLVYRSKDLSPVAMPADWDGAGRTIAMPGPGECWITGHSLQDYDVRILAPLSIPMAALQSFVEISVVLIVLGLLLSLGLGAIHAQWVLRPIREIAGTAARISVKNLRERIPLASEASRDEVRSLAELLNGMFARLEDSVDRIRSFSTEASHELRTPLSIVRLDAEKIAATPDLPSMVYGLAEEQTQAIDRLNRVIGGLLDLAKLEGGGIPLRRQTTDLGAFLNDFAVDADLLCEDSGRQFILDVRDPGPLHMDPDWMRQVLFNLLGNALRFSPDGGRITLEAWSAGPSVCIVLSDEGPGVPPSDVERIFERFVRVGGGDPHVDKGVGLGLTLCRTVVGLHGGRIHAENRTDRSGLRMVLTFPVAS